MLLRRASVDLGVMAMNGCSAFPKAIALLELPHQIVQCHIQDTHWFFYPSAEMQSVYSTAPADWATTFSFSKCLCAITLLWVLLYPNESLPVNVGGKYIQPSKKTIVWNILLLPAMYIHFWCTLTNETITLSLIRLGKKFLFVTTPWALCMCVSSLSSFTSRQY